MYYTECFEIFEVAKTYLCVIPIDRRPKTIISILSKVSIISKKGWTKPSHSFLSLCI